MRDVMQVIKLIMQRCYAVGIKLTQGLVQVQHADEGEVGHARDCLQHPEPGRQPPINELAWHTSPAHAAAWHVQLPGCMMLHN